MCTRPEPAALDTAREIFMVNVEHVSLAWVGSPIASCWTFIVSRAASKATVLHHSLVVLSLAAGRGKLLQAKSAPPSLPTMENLRCGALNSQRLTVNIHILVSSFRKWWKLTAGRGSQQKSRLGSSRFLVVCALLSFRKIACSCFLYMARKYFYCQLMTSIYIPAS